MKVLDLVENELEKFSSKVFNNTVFYIQFMEEYVLEANNYKTGKFYENSHQFILLLITSHQPANFRGEGS